ncbi:MAG: RCC1 repeat-containing protein [Caldilinea sp. CFX5]|nr:RCC1 repeat-containing protein [Caldilinea sp. CFX5]
MRLQYTLRHLPHWHFLRNVGLILSSIGLTVSALFVLQTAVLAQALTGETTLPTDLATAAGLVNAAATPFAALVAGDEHSCGLTTGGAVLCWGANGDGQAGDGSPFAYRPPVAVFGLPSGVLMLAANGSHSCALQNSGGVVCWGNNSAGQLGDGGVTERRMPVAVTGLAEVVKAITAGGGHSCAILQSGGVQCWGRNGNGQLGNGANANQTTAVAVTGLAGPVTALAAGANHTCALLQSGAIQCWGDNANGQLGNQTTVSRNVPTAVIGLAGPAKGIAAGLDHTCAILNDGRLQCWGDNARGQLGDSTREDKSSPVLVNNLRDVIATVAAGRFHTCALAIDGDLYCWGTNNRGQLGTGTVDSSRAPLRVVGVPGDAVALTAGLDHACALFKNNLAYCWGSNRSRQLGRDAPGLASVPQFLQPAILSDGSAPVAGIPTIVGGRYHTCLITPLRTLQCWGRNSDGQLGDGTQLPRPRPLNVTGLTGVTAVALGAEHTCALLQSGGVKCWGANVAGQLGNGTTREQLTPADVIGLGGAAVALAAGDDYTCALVQPGGVKCWGLNTAGQLGDGTTTAASVPVNAAGLSSGVVAITAGTEHTCALLQSGGVKCWGANAAGQLGDGTTVNRSTPVDVSGLAGVTKIDAGGAHTCAALTDGSLRCWGANNSGQLGDGARVGQLLPVAVNGLPGAATAVEAGIVHTCALLSGGSVVCWGNNEYTQMGDGTATLRTAPTPVSGLAANVLSLQVGGYHTCVLVTGNRPLCWGRDSDGQLGAGALTQSTTLAPLEETRPPRLTINYVTAQVNSTLTLVGSGLPYSGTLPLLVNGVTVTDTLSINPAGEFIVYLTTQGANAGAYTVQVGNPPSATAFFLLRENATPRPAEGSGVTFALPAGVGRPIMDFYLPVSSR